MSNIYTIYKVTNLVNQKIYIGFTKFTEAERFATHCKGAKGNAQTYLHRAIRKYGEESFKVEVVYQSSHKKHTKEEMEKFFIALFESNNPKIGYNMTSGGEGNDSPRSEATRKKISESTNNSGEQNPMFGRTHSIETKAKIGKKSEGREFSAEARSKISEAGKGRKYSKERNQKISDYWKGRKRSDKQKEDLSDYWKDKYENGYVNPMTGRKNTMEKVKCPHCKKEGGKQNMKRYHFDNCKELKNETLSNTG